MMPGSSLVCPMSTCFVPETLQRPCQGQFGVPQVCRQSPPRLYQFRAARRASALRKRKRRWRRRERDHALSGRWNTPWSDFSLGQGSLVDSGACSQSWHFAGALDGAAVGATAGWVDVAPVGAAFDLATDSPTSSSDADVSANVSASE